MRQRFRHYLPLTLPELDQVWHAADVTLDANVLLDLYRYHAGTRESLLEVLGTFRGRLWLSHQAAEEFFRNRAKVIAGALQDFGAAEEALKALEKALSSSIDRLRALRLVPQDLHQALSRVLEKPLKEARSRLKSSQDAHPDFLTADPVLDEVLALFDGSVGAEPSEDERKRLDREGEDRKKRQVPPGYLDSSKTENSSGDFVLWHQVLQHARETERPVILITSERKDDWWERQDGRRIGPRRELLAEAATVARQRVVLYETQNFLTTADRRRGRAIDEKAIADIRKVGMHRGIGADEEALDPEAIAHRALDKLAYELVTSDDVIASLIAESDGKNFKVEAIEIDGVGNIDLKDASFAFAGVVYLRGKPRSRQVEPRTVIVAEVAGTVHFRNGGWRVADYDVRGELQHDVDATEARDAAV
jgi:hypothetical protein